MAKRKKSKTVYRTKNIVRRIGNRTKRAGGLVAGLIAGATGSLINRFAPLGQWAQPAADIGTGYLMGNDTLQTIGGRSVGAMLANGGLGAMTNGNNNASNPLVG